MQYLTAILFFITLTQAQNGFVDFVVVMDESGSMVGEQIFILQAVPLIDEALKARGFGNDTTDLNLFAAIGYGAADPTPRVVTDFTDSATFVATTSFFLSGGTEDGYDGIIATNESLSFRSDAVKNIVLVTDEDRDVFDSGDTRADVLDLILGLDAILNLVVNVRIENDGVQQIGLCYNETEDGSGTLTTSFVQGVDDDGNPVGIPMDGGAVVSGFGTTIPDYVDLLDELDAARFAGCVFDLNILRAGGNASAAFAQTFVDRKVEEIVSNMMPPCRDITVGCTTDMECQMFTHPSSYCKTYFPHQPPFVCQGCKGGCCMDPVGFDNNNNN